jgi:glycosyltransferase involved in cell wall biosynthesis
MVNKNDITVAIVSYYRGDRLKVCLESLKDIKNIIVWDNNTKGEELEKIKNVEKDFQHVKFIYSQENYGLTKPYNECIINSNTDWVLLTCDDMIFDNDWFEIFAQILAEKPQLEQIYLNTFNAWLLHKKTIVRMGWFDESYRYYPNMEDDDWYLRIVEELKYSPYGGIPDHLKNYFPDWYQKVALKLNYKEQHFNDESNFTFFCNSIYNKKYKIIGKETTTGGNQDAGSRNTVEAQIEPSKGMTGIEYHFTKWKQIVNVDELFDDDTYFSKDGRAYKRIKEELDPYSEIRKQYAKKYFNIEL